MRILITGALGLLGSRLAQYFGGRSDVDVLLGSRKDTVPPEWVSSCMVKTIWDSSDELGRICDGVDAIVHLAGMNAQDCAADPVAALSFNGVATARLIQAAVRRGVRRFVHMSTAHVYASPLVGTISEQDCPRNLHPYATSHRAGEDVVRAASAKGEINGVVIRLSNAFGAPAHAGANCWMLLANDLCRQAICDGKMVLRTSGLQRRDFIPISDVCRAVEHLLMLPAERLDNGLFNVGGDWAPSVLEIADLIARRMRETMSVEVLVLRPQVVQGEVSEPLHYDISKLVGTGFAPGGNSAIEQEIDGLIEFCRQRAVA